MLYGLVVNSRKERQQDNIISPQSLSTVFVWRGMPFAESSLCVYKYIHATRRSNVGLMMARRRRRRAIISPTLDRLIVVAMTAELLF